MLLYAALLIFPFAMLVAASMDLLTMTIPNRVSLALVAGFFVLAPFSGLGWGDLAQHVAVALALLLVGMFMFAMRWMGGGDAKLLAATSLWLGYDIQLFHYALIASVFGAILTLFILIYRGMPLFPWALRAPWLIRLHDRKEGVPYGVALALAGLVIYPKTVWMTGVL